MSVPIDPTTPVWLEEPNLPRERIQRVAFPIRVSIDKSPGNFPQQVTVQAAYGRFRCSATLGLAQQPVPFMQDGPDKQLLVCS